MAEKVFELNGKSELIGRKWKNLRKAFQYQQEMGKLLKSDPASDITSDEYDPSAYFVTQEKIMELRIKFLSTFFTVSEKAFDEIDPVEIVDISDELYSFFMGNETETEEDESGEA